jgi:hypothetical protein
MKPDDTDITRTPEDAAAAPGDTADEPTGPIAGPPARERAPLWRRLLFGAFVTLAVLFFVGAMLYRFGSMWVPSAETRAEYDELVASGQVPDQVTRQFHIPIPGCVCHSDDPVLTMQHSTRRVSECMQCHGGG